MNHNYIYIYTYVQYSTHVSLFTEISIEMVKSKLLYMVEGKGGMWKTTCLNKSIKFLRLTGPLQTA